ncbi:MAG: ATP-binding protein [Planctomycetes bacterium]|nr:ATP-binding protein [Planctomycetota bacterium]
MSRSTTSHPFTDADEIFSGQIASRLDQRDRLINEVLKKLKAAGCRPDPFFDRLSLDETISNAILHGNLQDPSKRVTVRAFSRKDCWGVEVADQGNGFDWKALLKKLRGPPDTESSSGRGLALILASGAELYFFDGGRRVVFVRKKIER